MDLPKNTKTDEPSTNDTTVPRGRCYVAVHIGAGYHSTKRAKEYRTAMKAACAAAMRILRSQQDASDAVEAAIMELENAPVTNAGVGSNLNRLGQVECDAAIMTAAPQDAFGAVGCVSAIRNPIQGANAVRKAYAQGPDTVIGLVPPMLLAGWGADTWAREQGIQMDQNNRCKITEDSLARYADYMDRMASVTPTEQGKANLVATCDSEDLLMDTVGAVCIDARGNIASGVSSGGIALKIPGRVGEAAMFGCGCWAESGIRSTDSQKLTSGCSVSGTGEQIMCTMLGRDCAQRTKDIFTALEECFESFNSTPLLSRYEHRSAGLILLRQASSDSAEDCDKTTELGVAHTTHSMGYGYMADNMDEPKAKISRKQKDTTRTAILAIKL